MVPAWSIASLAQPTRFLASNGSGEFVLTVTNTGSAPASAPIVISDVLPPQLQAIGLSGYDVETGQPLGCNVLSVRCEYSEQIQMGDTLVVRVNVAIVSPTESVLNSARVEGGGASATTSAPLTTPTSISGEPGSFGVADFEMDARAINGEPDHQASDHPYAVTTTFHLNSQLQNVGGESRVEPAHQVKDLVAYLPLGFVGSPQAAARCTETQLIGRQAEFTLCPAASRVGTALIYQEGKVAGTVHPGNLVSAIYNMVPDAGYPAEFGFKVAGKLVPLYASVAHSPSGYVLRAGTPGVPRTLGFYGAVLTFFGDPNEANGEPNGPQAFFANPSNCSGGSLTAKVEADSWAEPGHWFSAESVVYPLVTGCDLLQFAPSVEMRPEVTEAEAPAGFEIKVKAPQSPNQFPVLATPDLKNITMTLPEGMTASPSAADGLVGCEATGPGGIDMPGSPLHPNEVASEGEEIGPDGMSHLVHGHCPSASQIGTVEIKTPLLEKPLEGHVYLAQPLCGGEGPNRCTTADATNGRLFGLYLEAEGSGVVIKLGGRISANPTTGQLTARFTELPQQPVSEVTVHLKGGVRAPLANPRQCGEAVTNTDFTAWGTPAVPDALSSTQFPVDWDGNGGPCPPELPFAPTLTAGSASATAGHSGPFTLTVQRADRMKDISRLQVRLPSGLLGMLSSVALCREPQASEGTCSEASEIGHVSVAVGSGSHPFVVNGGHVYLTDGYAGAPFGLSVVVPAVAGPFNLGHIVVRSAISVDPATAAITITSDPLPQFLDGIPLRIQTLNVSVDRPGFMFNPTNCSVRHITATFEAEQGGTAEASSPFAVEGCNTLAFKPTFSVSTQAKTSKKGGASLKVKVTSGPGQDNIGGVVATLPKQLPARLTTLQQACLAATFAQNPAQCPAASNVGMVKAITPVLNEPLTGPAYLVSHGGAAFPDLVVILQGQGVRLDLTGNTAIKKGITTSTFASVPDAPISSFELALPQGPHSALTGNLPTKAKGSFCGTKLTMPTTLTAQNGAQIKQSTKIAVLGCPKAIKHKRKKKK
jgi:uncharacterized repeat protein (TIGR01451 family)